MSDTAPSFGGEAYSSQTTKALTSITESPGPDLSDGEQQFVEMLSRHDYQIKFLADNQQQLQVGVNQATSNPIQQIQQFIADVQVLVSGAALPKGALDFGDLQYELPALGALFGFGTGGPVNLFQAAENFFFGYVVPQQQYTDLQIAGFNSYAQALGIDPQFVKDVDSMVQAFGDLFNGLQNLGPSLASLFDELGISGTDLGPLGQLLAPILKWFAPIDFSKFGSMIEWLTDAIEPWVTGVTAVINWVNSLLAAIGAGGDVVNSPLPQVTTPFANLIRLFATLDLSDPEFSTTQGWNDLFQEVFIDLEQFGAGVWAWITGAPLNAGNLYGQLSPGLFSNIPGTAITDDDTNLLSNPAFNGAISVSGKGIWTWDGYCYYPPDDVIPNPGSVVVVADGTRKQLDSNQVTVGAKKQVTPGRVLTYAVQVLATHLTATGTPVQMGVETNLGVTILDQTLPLTVAETTPWVNPPTGSNAGVLSGTYLVPQDGSVTWVSMILVVDTTATAGVVRFSNAFELLTGGLIGDMQSDLADLQDDATRINDANNAWYAALGTALATYLTNFDWSELIGTLTPAYNTWMTTITDLDADEFATLTSIFDSLLGIDPSTGQSIFFEQVFSWLTGTNTASGNLTSIAAPAVTNTDHSAQSVPNFPNAASLVGVWYAGGGWEWDSSVTYTDPATGVTSAGSAKCTANGAVQAQNGVITKVQPGQTVTLLPKAQWSGLSAASGTSPIQAQLVPWSGTDSPGTAAAPVTLAEVTSPSPAETSWTGLTSVTDSGAGVADGVYTVPDSGVGFVQARIVVTADATAGSVWWNACDTVISGGFLPTMNDDIARLKSDGEASTVATQTFLQAVLTAITGYTDWSTFIAAVESAYQTWVTTESGLAADEFATLQQMLNSLLGIDSSTGRNTQWAALMAQITALQTLLASPPVSAAAWASWWTATLEALGVDSTDAVNTANFLSGNYSSAINANAWVTRLLTDATVFLDLLHWTYQPGSSSDAPGTLGTNGKPTWWSAVNDVLALFHIATTVTAPASGGSTPGQVIAANTAAATTAGTNASIAIAAAGAADTKAQGTIDGLNSAWSAGGTGNPVSSIPTIAAAIPTSAIVGGTGAAVTFGAVGSGNYNATTSGTGLTLSETHSIISTDLGVLVFVSYFAASISGITWSTSVTYGGVAMTQIGPPLISGTSGGGGSMFQEVWWLKSPPTGAKTVTATVTHSGGPSGNILSLMLNSVSYLASKVASINAFQGGGTSSLSMTGSSVAGNMLVGAFSLWCNPTLTVSAFNQTSRWSEVDSAFAEAMVIGDAAGASSVTFSETINKPSPSGWVGYLVELSN